MSVVTKWPFLICLTSIIATSIEFLIPPGKIGKTMNLILELFCVIMFFVPFSSKYHNFKNIFKNNDFKNILGSKTPTKNELSESLNKQVIDETCEKIKFIILNNLKNINVYPKKIDILMDKNEYGRIVINKCKILVNTKDIDLKEKITNEIESKLNIKTEVIKNAP